MNRSSSVRFFASFSNEEVRKFSKQMKDWWNPISGPSKALHQMNGFRTKFVRQFVCDSLRIEKFQDLPLKNLSVLDVGCGGGLLSESLARLGGTVLGIDASEAAVEVATQHANDAFGDRLKYRVGTTDELLSEGSSGFDLVVCSEVLEHVTDHEKTIQDLSSLSKCGKVGVVVSTLNRTVGR